MSTESHDVVRPAGIAELPGLLVLVQAAYRGDASRAGWTTEADLIEGRRADAAMLRELLVRPDAAVLRVGQRGAPHGCCTLEHGGGRVRLGMFAVAPPRQGQGTGGALLTAAERYAQGRWHARAVELTVIAQRAELIAWYERRGYARTGAVEPFPYGDERFGRPLRDDLELVVMRHPFGPS